MSSNAEGEIQYWFELIIQADTGAGEQQHIVEKIPAHLFRQISDRVAQHYRDIIDTDHRQEEIEKNYKEDTEYGMDVHKTRNLPETAIDLGSVDGTPVQTTPYVRGKSLDEHLHYYRTAELFSASLHEYKRTSGSDNPTDILPHLFKQQKWYAGISNDIDTSMATAIEDGADGDRQVHMLTRLKHRVSGSMFRDMADTTFEEELQVMDKTKDPGEVMEKRMDNANPFRGKFTFRTSYGPPPTASLSQSTVSYTAVKDFGVTDWGPEFTLYNTTTGSLSSGSHLHVDGPPYYYEGELMGLGTTKFATTASVFETLRFKEGPSRIAYTAKWEQDVTVTSQASTTITVLYRNKQYKTSMYNSSMNTLFPTRKTVLKNGTIFIT